MPQTLEKRVATLEAQMMELRELPARVAEVGSQIVQLRAEMRSEFSATIMLLRGEIRAGDEETRALMRVLHEDVIGRIALLQEHGKPARKRPR